VNGGSYRCIYPWCSPSTAIRTDHRSISHLRFTNTVTTRSHFPPCTNTLDSFGFKYFWMLWAFQQFAIHSLYRVRGRHYTCNDLYPWLKYKRCHVAYFVTFIVDSHLNLKSEPVHCRRSSVCAALISQDIPSPTCLSPELTPGSGALRCTQSD
jgi:hypothetical protein